MELKIKINQVMQLPEWTGIKMIRWGRMKLKKMTQILTGIKGVLI